MKVADLMTQCVITVSPDTELRKVNALMHRYNIQSIVVVSKDGSMEGIVTYTDLFRQLLPGYEEVMKDETYWLNPESMEGRISQLVDRPVKEVMTTDVLTVKPDMPAVRAGALMNAHRVKQLPVVDGSKLVGIISYTDITWGTLMKSFGLF